MKILPMSLVALLAACATASHGERQALLAEPVSCATAEEDLAALEAALPSPGERARSAVQSVTPVGAASGVVSGDYDERVDVLTGRTSQDLIARMDEIRSTCGLAEQNDSTE
ncbi:MAG: hypothetical protein AAFQ22_13065 [Pseudomonadota bacterium]